MDELRAESWEQLHALLYEDSWQDDIGRHRSTWAFRGRSDAGEDLRTSLIRLGGDPAQLEGHLLRAFRKYAILILLALSAIITPSTDPFNMAIVFFPLYLLYEAGILVARLFARKPVENPAGTRSDG